MFSGSPSSENLNVIIDLDHRLLRAVRPWGFIRRDALKIKLRILYGMNKVTRVKVAGLVMFTYFYVHSCKVTAATDVGMSAAQTFKWFLS